MRRLGRVLLAAGLVGPVLVPHQSAGPQNARMSPNVRLVTHIPYTSGTDIDFRGDRVYFAQSGAVTNGRVRILDVSRRPRLIGEFVCGGNQNDVAAITEDIIALGSHWGHCGVQPSMGVNLLDVSDPANPRQLGFSTMPVGTHTLTKYPGEPLIYTSSSLNQLRHYIIDVSNPMVPITIPTNLQACHDISFHFSKRGKFAFCAAGSVSTEIWDVSDPMSPEVIAEIRDGDIGYHHLAVATPDGKYLVIGDESTGGSCSGNARQRERGALSIYDISNITEPKLVSFINAPRGPAVCWAHNFNFVPRTRTLVMAWWQAGTSVYDLSNPRRPREIAHFQPDTAAVWSSYWYRGRIYVNSGSGAYVLEVRGLEGR
jgi:hypothetical protein